MGDTVRTFHMSQSITGPLVTWNHEEWIEALGYITRGDGQKFKTVDDLRRAFVEEALKGHVVVPIGPCDGFDFKTGCPGHESPAQAARP